MSSNSVVLGVEQMYGLLREKAPDDPAFQHLEFPEWVRLCKKFMPPTTQARYNILAPDILFTAFEIGIMRGDPDNPEIVLGRRAPGDVLYAGQYHSFGSMGRPSDALSENDPTLMETGKFGCADFFQAPILRVLVELGFTREEIYQSGLSLFKQTPVNVGSFAHETPRGPEIAALFIGEIEDEPPKGLFFEVKDILTDPKCFNLIDHHIAVITQMAFRYKHFYPTLRTWQGW